MLGKLIKYDMKVLNRFLLLIHVFLLLAAFCGRYFLTSRIIITADNIDGTTFNVDQFMLSLAIILFIIIVSGASFGTYIIIAVRFYKNLYSDEGYLTHTLPVTAGTHLLSKTISGSIWAFIDSIAVTAAMWIVIVTPSVSDAFAENKDTILEVLGFSNNMTPGFLFAAFILFCVVSSISNMIMIYAAIVCGQLFSNHRILGAVVSYLGLQTIISILSLVSLAITGYFSDMLYMSSTQTEAVTSFAEIFSKTFIFSGIMMVIIMIVLYIFTYCLMRRKVNLQ